MRTKMCPIKKLCVAAAMPLSRINSISSSLTSLTYKKSYIVYCDRLIIINDQFSYRSEVIVAYNVNTNQNCYTGLKP